MRVQVCDGRAGACGAFIELDGPTLDDYLARKWVMCAKVQPVAEPPPEPEPEPEAPKPVEKLKIKRTARFDKK